MSILPKNSNVFIATLCMLSSFFTHATVVEIRTSIGVIEVNLFDETTSETVENFLSYVNSGAYANAVVHRSINGFIIQSGGFQYTGQAAAGEVPLDGIESGPAVVNEPLWSNLRGTIAMAKLSGSPDSATSQWFINLSDNSTNLDQQNSGFTVFGQVQGDGMQVVDAISELDVVNLGGVFTDIPMPNYTGTDFANAVVISEDNLLVISDVVVTDTTVNSASVLSPVQNTLIDGSDSSDDLVSSGGGAIIWLTLLSLLTLYQRRK